MDGGAFTKKDSRALKGVAILMMMWHHCFLPGRFEAYRINFFPFQQSQVVNIAVFCKICVSLFTFISGYGLYFAYQKKKAAGEHTGNWLVKRLVKMLSSYWFVVVLSWIVCMIIDRRPYHFYQFETSPFVGFWNMAIDFLGLSNLTGIGRFGEDWWYISAAIAFILLLPLLDASLEKFGCVCTMGVLFLFPRMTNGFLGGVHFLSFLPIFCLGMIFAKKDVFAKWQELMRRSGKWKKALIVLALIVLALIIYKLYYHLQLKKWWDVKFNVFPLAVIILCYTLGNLLPALKSVLAFFGKHATNIWLIHAFIRHTYTEAFTYGFGHFAVIIAVLFVISLVLSIVIEFMKKTLHYQSLIDQILRKI